MDNENKDNSLADSIVRDATGTPTASDSRTRTQGLMAQSGERGEAVLQEAEDDMQAYINQMVDTIREERSSLAPTESLRPKPREGDTNAPFTSRRPNKRSGDEIYKGLVERGMPEHVAKGFVINFRDESGLDAGINEINPLVKGSRGGFGLYQLTGPRRVEYEKFAEDRGVDPSNVDAQLDFLMLELNSKEKSAAEKIYNTSTSGEAAAAIVNNFLRPKKEYRDKRAKRYLSQSL